LAQSGFHNAVRTFFSSAVEFSTGYLRFMYHRQANPETPWERIVA
jgi:hypothetical protein